MRYILLFWFIVSSNFAFAHFDPISVYKEDSYDVSTGYFYKMISAKADAGAFSSSVPDRNTNIFVYDPKTKSGRNIFVKSPGSITGYVLESQYNKVGQSIEYLMTGMQVKNNKEIAERPLKNTILIESYVDDTKTYTVWRTDKLSGQTTELFHYQRPSAWHVNAKTGTIMLVTPTDKSYDVVQYNW